MSKALDHVKSICSLPPHVPPPPIVEDELRLRAAKKLLQLHGQEQQDEHDDPNVVSPDLASIAATSVQDVSKLVLDQEDEADDDDCSNLSAEKCACIVDCVFESVDDAIICSNKKPRLE